MIASSMKTPYKIIISLLVAVLGLFAIWAYNLRTTPPAGGGGGVYNPATGQFHNLDDFENDKN